MGNPFETLEKKLSTIESQLNTIIEKDSQPPTKEKEFLSEYISKNEVRGKLASSSTLWKYEKEGKISVYGIGGKRFYKKSEIEQAFIKLNKKVDAI
jgi:hypothetical protein|tara:strand:- start:1147 stop:1434 length:288 start_codon:yes stop_codon:yes gene_type:complete